MSDNPAGAGVRDDRTSTTAWLAGIHRLYGDVADKPFPLLFAAGVLVLIGGLLSKVGTFEVVIVGSQTTTLAMGAGMCLVGLVGQVYTSRRDDRRLAALAPQSEQGPDMPAEARDAEFLMKVFYETMPAAFVKRRVASSGSDREFENILWSKDLVRFQDARQTEPVGPGDELHRLILDDHAHGDRMAQSGTSIQIEFPRSYVNGRLRPILTFKRSFEHGDQTYVAGWYVPIEGTDIPVDAESISLRDEVDAVRFRLAIAEPGDGIEASIGKAVRSRRRVVREGSG
jgi:hypothetical protein